MHGGEKEKNRKTDGEIMTSFAFEHASGLDQNNIFIPTYLLPNLILNSVSGKMVKLSI